MKQKKVTVANLAGQQVIIKAGAESIYGKTFANDTWGTLIPEYDRKPHYYGIRLDHRVVVLIPREFVILPDAQQF